MYKDNVHIVQGSVSVFCIDNQPPHPLTLSLPIHTPTQLITSPIQTECMQYIQYVGAVDFHGSRIGILWHLLLISEPSLLYCKCFMKFSAVSHKFQYLGSKMTMYTLYKQVMMGIR